MTEGHPVFVANSGRIGFDAIDYPHTRPKRRGQVALIWLAAHEGRASFACVADLSYDKLMRGGAGPGPARRRSPGSCARGGLDPAHYRLSAGAPLAMGQQDRPAVRRRSGQRRPGLPGAGPDSHRPQQSIRTLFNISRPQRRYVKTALSILNMGFYRGISAAITQRAAAVNDWVGQPGGQRRYPVGAWASRSCARWRSSATATGITSAPAPGAATPTRRCWRRSGERARCRACAPGERLMTMAALMHRRRRRRAVLPELIRASGLTSTLGLQAYLRAYLVPQLHCFYRARPGLHPPLRERAAGAAGPRAGAHDPEGHRRGHRGAQSRRRPCPSGSRTWPCASPRRWPPSASSPTPSTACSASWPRSCTSRPRYPQASFWRLVAACILEYQAAHPQLAAQVPPLRPVRADVRPQLPEPTAADNNQEMIDLNAPDPVASLQFAGTLANPIAPFAPRGGAPHPHGTERCLAGRPPAPAACFGKVVPRLGALPAAPPASPDDLAVVHGWVNQEHARYWGLVGKSLEEVASAYQDIARRADVYLGFFGTAPAFLLETYWPGRGPGRPALSTSRPATGECTSWWRRPEQAGWPGFTWAVFGTVMDFLFADPDSRARRCRAGHPQRQDPRAQPAGRFPLPAGPRAAAQDGPPGVLHPRAICPGGGGGSAGQRAEGGPAASCARTCSPRSGRR